MLKTYTKANCDDFISLESDRILRFKRFFSDIGCNLGSVVYLYSS